VSITYFNDESAMVTMMKLENIDELVNLIIYYLMTLLGKKINSEAS
jgi:hypothetical protein